ncbi:hypothetical protein LCGC14_0941930 [marine sediment metagenome]|uniref:Uncharacterized protein n=1 Tax=marine sediment metagenome TaxID=412755 RepID=A0A0F9NPH0_9ZZZZ
MFQKGDEVFVRPLQYNHGLKKFSGCAGTVESVEAAMVRCDDHAGIADLVTVLFENWDGQGGEIRENFDENDLGRNRRSIEMVTPVEWEHERRITFFDRLKTRLGK